MASKSSTAGRDDRRRAFWQNSVYEEPPWVSLGWILAPILLAGIAIYAALS